ncbi:MAG: DUF2971 domain-containing protein [Spongiibacteraceae bacterium]|nr:DUF2971 domain-containing protein [Spongiibacteraceae bacterium]
MTTKDIISLVKFCDTETGLKILNSQSLRWSSPHLFNDPFELGHHSAPSVNNQNLVSGIIKDAINMLFGPTEPKGKSNRLVAAISRWRDEDRFASEEEASIVLKQLLGQVAEQQIQTIDSYVSAWKEFASSIRICSFCEKPGNMSAWQRFGDNHNGIAMRFSCGENTALPNPQAINYGSAPPFVTSLKEQVSVCYGREEAPTHDGFLGKLLSKSKENRSEQEWRCLAQEENKNDIGTDEQLWYSNKKFSSSELKAIYIGLATSLQDKEAVIKLVKDKYPKTKVYQAQALAGRYEIDFSAIGTR